MVDSSDSSEFTVPKCRICVSVYYMHSFKI